MGGDLQALEAATASVIEGARKTRATAASLRTEARSSSARARLVRGQAAAIRVKVEAGARLPRGVDYEAVVLDLVTSARLLRHLESSASPPELLRAARDAHRWLLARYAALGPSLPN
jgi:hypothetical protein